MPGLNWISAARWRFGAAAAHVCADGHHPQASGHRRCAAGRGRCPELSAAEPRRPGCPSRGSCAGRALSSAATAARSVGGVDAQVGALREVLAQQPVGVLVARPLPRAGLLAEVHRHAQRLRRSRRATPSPCPGPRSATGALRRQLRQNASIEGVADRVGGVPRRAGAAGS